MLLLLLPDDSRRQVTTDFAGWSPTLSAIILNRLVDAASPESDQARRFQDFVQVTSGAVTGTKLLKSGFAHFS
jgi:hypothetical protein